MSNAAAAAAARATTPPPSRRPPPAATSAEAVRLDQVESTPLSSEAAVSFGSAGGFTPDASALSFWPVVPPYNETGIQWAAGGGDAAADVPVCGGSGGR